MSSIYGDNIRLSIFGQSHSTAIGMTMDNIPAGLPIDMNKLHNFLSRRKPGQNTYSTPRIEEDIPEFICGIQNGFTCGAPITAIIRNTNAHSEDYENLKDRPRPGHADFTAQIKYGGFQDVVGGGHFSGRLTAPLCIAGGLCKQWLEAKGIQIGAHILSIGKINDEPIILDWTCPDLNLINSAFPVINPQAGEEMKELISNAKEAGDSVGGVVECIVTGLPAGIGDPMFQGMESRIAQIVFGIPAVKGLDFGSGFNGSSLYGSQNNDPFIIKEGRIVTKTNYAGGILGGITTGMPIVFRAAIKPTPSISMAQSTVSLSKLQEESIYVTGRHDPCIVPRVVPALEAAAAIAIFDALITEREVA